jgi:hypothetical protein
MGGLSREGKMKNGEGGMILVDRMQQLTFHTLSKNLSQETMSQRLGSLRTGGFSTRREVTAVLKLSSWRSIDERL